MESNHTAPSRRRARRILPRALVLGLAAVALTGCDNSNVWYRGGLPSPVTEQAKHVLGLWQGSLVAALAVGALVYGLILWSAVRFRQRGGALPRQVRYNIPIEVLYTAVPVVIISILFYFTVVVENKENKLSDKPDLTIGVVGFQWSWQFNYQGEDLSVTGRPGQPPQLVVPVGKKIQFIETSPDVIHSFWVVPFLFKRDVVPGRHNAFEVTVTKPGTYQGRCAEYCGTDHDRMLFTVRAVSQGDYESFVSSAKAAAATGKSDIYSTASATTGSSS